MSLVRRCTAPAKGLAYRDPPNVKEAIRVAKVSRTKASWVEVRKLRKQARGAWEAARLIRASQGDWGAFRSCKPRAQHGWEQTFASAQVCDAHAVVHDHLSAVYKGLGVAPNGGPFPGPVRAFTEDEFKTALGQLKGGKSVGVDGTSTELLHGIASLPGGCSHLLEFMNRTLATQVIPEEWNVPLMVILPKVLTPTEAKQVRPISMNSAVCKLFSRLLLNRTIQHIKARTHAQCAGVGRQSADYLYSVWRVLELEREWHAGLCLLKLDVAKAFDSVDRERLLHKLRERMGDSPEFRCWRALLQDSKAVLQTPWGTSLVSMTQGIKQGAVESPAIFAMIAEVCLQDATERFQWTQQPRVFQGLLHEDVLFMDDGILWGRGVEVLQSRVRQLMVVLAEYGLRLNGGKCQLLCSPHWHGARHVQIAEETVKASADIEVMGLPMRVGMSASELVAPLIGRARDKYWSLQHIFRARSRLRGRLRTLAAVVGNSVLWPLAAFPPDKSALGLLNSQQLQLTVWTMRLAKHTDEGLDAFRLRALQAARAALHHAGLERWGTCWLRRWWSYAGHRARSLLHEHPPLSAHLEAFRTLEWWEGQQRSTHGMRHPRHFPRLANLERDMNNAAGGDWRTVAQHRTKWKQCEQKWVDNMDLAWASGRQTRLGDRTQ